MTTNQPPQDAETLSPLNKLMTELLNLADLYANAVADNAEDDNPDAYRLETLEQAARSDLSEALEEALTASQPPAGMRLVPVEPTPEMIDAGCPCGEVLDHFDMRAAYTAMLDAAPSNPAPALPVSPEPALPALSDALRNIVALSAGWDKDGSLGPKPPWSWESVARMAMDYARAALASPQPAPDAPGTKPATATPKESS